MLLPSSREDISGWSRFLSNFPNRQFRLMLRADAGQKGTGISSAVCEPLLPVLERLPVIEHMRVIFLGDSSGLPHLGLPDGRVWNVGPCLYKTRVPLVLLWSRFGTHVFLRLLLRKTKGRPKCAGNPEWTVEFPSGTEILRKYSRTGAVAVVINHLISRQPCKSDTITYCNFIWFTSFSY